MSDPERLLHGSAGALSARLVRAGHDEGPSRRSLERTLAAVGVATTTLGAAGTAGALGSTAGAAGTAGALGAAGKATTLTLLGVAKWAGLGVAGGVVVSLAAHGLETRATAPRAATSVVVTAPAAPSAAHDATGPARRAAEIAVRRAEDAAPGEPSASPTDAKTTRRALVPAPTAAPLASTDDTTSAPLAAEVTFVDRARTLFQRGDTRGTLAALRDYEREFPERRLLPEVLLLRMEASNAAGDATGAQAFARAIVREYGKSPHVARARAVLSEAAGGRQ